MKKLFLLFVFIVPVLAFVSCDFAPAASAQTEFRTLFNDSINDIAATDSTISYPIRGNSPWSINVNTIGTITGTGGNFFIMESNDGINWTLLCAPDKSGDSSCDTIKTAIAFRLSGTTFPGKYLGLKITKGTCKGKLKASFSMKKPD